MINYFTYFPFKVRIIGFKRSKFDYFSQQMILSSTAFVNFRRD